MAYIVLHILTTNFYEISSGPFIFYDKPKILKIFLTFYKTSLRNFLIIYAVLQCNFHFSHISREK